ncbi:MAG: hypothetical protein OEU40_06240, partial [Gammaproteobacteria bacterium]|nr:hypothetical protein [Gammaproteobacteria bacterium]
MRCFASVATASTATVSTATVSAQPGEPVFVAAQLGEPVFVAARFAWLAVRESESVVPVLVLVATALPAVAG